VSKAEQMPYNKDEASTKVAFTPKGKDLEIKIGESPVYIWLTIP
jgi:hypothetical protein